MDPELYNAAVSGDIDFIETKICNEDSVFLSQTTPKKNTLLHTAAEFEQTEFVKKVCLKCLPSLIWQQNSKGDAPLHIAARVGCQELVDFLIEKASSVDIESRRKKVHEDLIGKVNVDLNTALHCAVREGNYGVVKSLIAAYPSLSRFANRADESPLYLAVVNGFHQIADLIVGSCPKLFSYKGPNGVTALHILARSTSGSTLSKKLIERRPEITKEADSIGWSPLHYAVAICEIEKVKILLEHDDSSAVYLLDHGGNSPLHVAAVQGNVNVIEEILKRRPDASDLMNEKGQTALHAAVIGGKQNVVRYILGSPRLVGLINEADNDGNTPLHLAVIYEKYPIITILAKDARIDIKATNKELKTACEIYYNFSKLGFKAAKVEYLLRGTCYLLCQEWYCRDSARKKLNNNNAANPSVPEFVEDSGNQHDTSDWIEVNLLLAMLVTTVSFAAVFTMPGGYINDGQDQGLPIFREKLDFKIFVVFDSLAFFLSLVAVMYQLCALTSLTCSFETRARYRNLQYLLIGFALLALAIAFASAIHAVLANGNIGWTAYILLALISGIFIACFLVDPWTYEYPCLKGSQKYARDLLYRWGIL